MTITCIFSLFLLDVYIFLKMHVSPTPSLKPIITLFSQVTGDIVGPFVVKSDVKYRPRDA